jgi:hypothetical protein
MTPELKNPQQFEDAIDKMLSAQSYYDAQLFRDMGVELIWYDDHVQVPGLLRQIPGR